MIANGPEGGTYHAFGVVLARVFEAEKVVDRAEAEVTDGSVTNMLRIDGAVGGADLPFVRGDTHPAEAARLVASLYDEVPHILLAKGLADESFPILQNQFRDEFAAVNARIREEQASA